MIRGLFLATYMAASMADSNVLVLTDSNFDKTIKEHKLIMVEFYAPWCGHCKKLAPEYEKAADMLVDTDAKLAMLDATEEKNTGDEFEIKGFPTLKLFKNGKPIDYEGGRTADDIAKYMKSFIGPAVKPADDQEALDKLAADNSVLVVLFADAKDEKSLDTIDKFNSIADDNRQSFTFAAAPTSLNTVNKGKSGLVVVKSFDDGAVAYDGDFEAAAVMEFVNGESLPLLAEVGPENYSKYMARGLPFAWLFIDPEDKDVTDAAIEQVTAAAKDFKGKMSFVWLSGKQYESMVTKMALSGKKLPALSIEDSKGRHFPLSEEGDVKTAAVKELVQGVLDGKIEAKIKSEPARETNPDPDDGVWVLTGNSFEEEALKADKDVLVEFYAPWCGHCKKLAPVFAEVADYLKDVSGIRIAKMDATINDPPADIEVRGFPTLKFKKAGTSEFTDYNSGRDKEAFLSFLKKNAKAEFEYDA